MNIPKILTPKAMTAYIGADDTVRQGLEVMRRHGYTAIPVLGEHGEYIGCITEGDFLRHILSTGSTSMKAQERFRIGELVRRDFCPPLGIAADDDEVIDAVLQQNFVPIVDDRGCFCGIVTRRSVIAALANAEAALIGKAI
ncbi:MAG TPA: CBS domain-containing protein [Candidatus Scatomorpha merdipullorum]|uniref:CBS domain-containing protein n=1 Tax=Candidatus Scatomorpha merdipullorum TaxID=2840927 RepID=A0A9D1JUH8_9FIRM|nr:CBS domain-containing protein [Candidatus Scatomorpha merdipullorum]